MEKSLFVLIMLFFPIILFGQKKYKYEYRKHLTRQQSTFTYITSDTLLESNKSALTFHVLDKKGEAIPFVNVTIKNKEIDSTIRSDFDGLIAIKISSGIFSISIFHPEFTHINLDSLVIKENTLTTIKTSLGESNVLSIALIQSTRKLTDEEIDKLIDDLSNEREENELIKNKTCFIMWEI